MADLTQATSLRGSRATAATARSDHHATRPLDEGPDTHELARLVAHATGATHTAVDEHYRLTAFVIERRNDDDIQTVVVELMDHGDGTGETRWLAAAYDELSEKASGLSSGPTAEEALDRLDWDQISWPRDHPRTSGI